MNRYILRLLPLLLLTGLALASATSCGLGDKGQEQDTTAWDYKAPPAMPVNRAITGDSMGLIANAEIHRLPIYIEQRPLKEIFNDSNALQPLPPARIQYAEAPPQSPNVSINIMTPAFRTELQLAYQSHQLEEQRKAQQGGAMTIGTNLIPLVGHLLRKLFPQRKSKKQREREKLQRVLDNY